MLQKIEEKRIAIELRKQGLTYNEILKQVPVAKSSLSLWLRSVGLAKKQRQRLTQKKLEAALRGGEARKRERVSTTSFLQQKAKEEVGKLTEREKWLIGIALYWAEGSKEKEENPGSSAKFANSDPRMIQFFIKWLKDICLLEKHELVYELYIHETADWQKARSLWALDIGIPEEKIRVYFKKNSLFPTNRKNIGETYRGLLRVKVPRSSNLVREIEGWVRGIVQNCRVV